SRLPRQCLVWYRGAGQGARGDRAGARRRHEPCAERRGIPGVADQDRLLAAPRAQRGRDQGVHRCRQGALVERHQEAEHIAGLRRMVRENEIREGELAIDLPSAQDAGLVFIGRIRTPWTSRLATPRQGRLDGPVCRLEIFEPFVPAIKGVDFYSNLEVIYWLHQSRRDLVLQSPKNNKNTRGTFSLRSPVRPNPIATSIVKFVGIEGNAVLVRGLDCLDGTPLLDIKPDRCEFTPLAPPQAGDFETE